MANKYKLTGESKTIIVALETTVTLHRIEALVDFADVSAGETGGWIESEKNLSQNGDAWVYDNAWVYGDALVNDDAEVCENARVYGKARISGDALVYGSAQVYGNALVYGDAEVYGDARVYGSADVYGDARVYGNALVCGNAQISLKKAYVGGVFVHSTENTHAEVETIDQTEADDFDSCEDYARLFAIDPRIEDIKDAEKEEEPKAMSQLEQLKKEVEELNKRIERLAGNE